MGKVKKRVLLFALQGRNDIAQGVSSGCDLDSGAFRFYYSGDLNFVSVVS